MYARRSEGLAQHMRNRKALRKAERDLEEEKQKNAKNQDHIEIVESLLPRWKRRMANHLADSQVAAYRRSGSQKPQDQVRKQLVSLHWTFDHDLKNDYYLPGVGLLAMSREVVACAAQNKQLERFREMLATCKVNAHKPCCELIASSERFVPRSTNWPKSS